MAETEELTYSKVMEKAGQLRAICHRFLDGEATEREEEFVILHVAPATLMAFAIARGNKPIPFTGPV